MFFPCTLLAITSLSLLPGPLFAQANVPAVQGPQAERPVPEGVSQPAGLPEEVTPPSETALPAADFMLPVDFPLGRLQIGGQSAVIPDWRVLAFKDFPRFVADGRWGEVQWSAGDSILDVLTLGDVQADFQLQLLTVEAIGQQLGIRSNDLETVSLSSFQLLKRQTLATLVKAAPALLTESVTDVPLVKDLLLGVDPLLVREQLTVEEVLRQVPEYGEISLQSVDLNQYTLEDLPGIEVAPFQAFASWQEATLREVPLLEYVSLWSFPTGINLDGAIALASVVTESGESAVRAETAADTPSLSVQLDSYEDDRVPLRWDIGATQAGGFGDGELAQINDGREPLGMTPFGGAFLVVPHSATANDFQTALYFRSCRSEGEVMDCSPYGIGPLPFMAYPAGSNIFLGAVTFESLTPAPEVEAIAPPAEEAVEDNLVDVLLPTTTAKVAAGGSVGLILTLTLALIAWAAKGDPVGFFQSTAQWGWANCLRRFRKEER